MFDPTITLGAVLASLSFVVGLAIQGVYFVRWATRLETELKHLSALTQHLGERLLFVERQRGEE